MEPSTFFFHYLPALAEALRHDDEWEVFFVKGPDYYVEDEKLCRAMDEFIDAHSDTFPLFDRVGLYFDALSHNFPTIEGVPVQDYRVQIQQEAAVLQCMYELK